MIYFKCSQCNEHLEAPTSMTGEKLQCPVCKFPEVVPNNEEKIHFDIGGSISSGEGVAVATASTSETIVSETKVGITGTSQIKAFGKDNLRKEHKWNRQISKSGAGACRMKLFHSRLSPNAMEYMEDSINEWLDENPDVEVKFSESTVGVVEGKKSESHILITVWY